MVKSVYDYRIEKRFRRRLYFITGLVFVTTFIIILQLFVLQILHGYENRVLTKKFVSRQEFTIAPRGLFLDRNQRPGDQPLVQNLRFIDYVVRLDQFRTREEAEEYIRFFCKYMGRDFADFQNYLTPQNWKQLSTRNEYITLINHITRRQHERLALSPLPTGKGEYVTQHLRFYSMGPALAHISGFIGLPSENELKKKLAQSYQIIGKDGLEARYDSRLRGRDGVKVRHRTVDQEEQISTTEQGDNLVLTIDRDMQAAAYKALAATGKRGTAIALKASTGEILAMASTPAFDPNILSAGTTEQRTSHLREVTNYQGFINLAIQAKFPPGSSFKPLVALAALENIDPHKQFTEETSYNCPGSFTLRGKKAANNVVFKCLGVHGAKKMIDAIAYSCNVYFYNLGNQLGPEPIINYAKSFGLDKKTGVDLQNESEGLVPDSRWKQLNRDSRWFDGDTINLSIGQGFLQVTPIELAVLYAGLANRGKIFKPYLVKEIRDPIDNHLLNKFEPTLLREIPLSQEHLEIVQEGMRKVVTNGTAARLAVIPVPIAGKTGTVQTQAKLKGKDHAWFASYAPYNGEIEDTIVVVAFVEYGIWGASSAAPIAGEIYKAAFPNWNKKDESKIVKVESNTSKEED